MNISPIPSPPIPILLKVLAVGVLVTIAILVVHGVVFVLNWVWELSPDYVDLLAYVYRPVQQEEPSELEMQEIVSGVDPHLHDNIPNFEERKCA